MGTPGTNFVKSARILGIYLALASSQHALYSQGIQSAASLAGHVADQTGAAIPGVALRLTETSQGARYEGASNQVGYFTFPHLPTGAYELRASKPGLADAVITPILLGAHQTSNVDITMKPGKVVQQIEVSASALRLETQTSDTTQSVAGASVSALPTQTRSPFSLIAIMPGVTSSFVDQGSGAGSAGAASPGGIRDWSRIDFNAVGAIQSTATVLIDGADTKQAHFFGMGTPAVVPSTDFTQEMKFQATNYGPEYGWGWGVVNVVTKSGTNALHGSLYDYWQNSALGANDFFNNAHGLPKGFLNRNQWGGAVGGPVIIPKLYNGKDRTWFFFNFERLQQVTPFQFQTRVPTQAELNGNFSGEYAADGQPITIYNPSSLTTGPNGEITRAAFPNNQIPASMISPFALKLASYYPAPNVTGGQLGAGGVPTFENNFFKNYSAHYLFTRIDTKVDEQISPKQHLMFRMSLNPDVTPGIQLYGNGNPASPSFGGPSQHLRTYWSNEMISHTWTPSPTFMVSQILSYARETYTQFYYGDGFDPTQLGGPFANGQITAFAKQHLGGVAFPGILMGDYGTLGTGGVKNQEGHTGQYEVDLSKIRGSHELKWGFQAETTQNGATDNGTYQPLGMPGTYAWNGNWTCGPNPLLCAAHTGNAFADAETGLVDSGQILTRFSLYASERRFAWYFSDNWRVTPRLTLNMGVRYDLDFTGYERYNNFQVFRPGVENPLGSQSGPNTGGKTLNQALGRTLMGAMVTSGTATANGSTRLGLTDPYDIAPRIGFAYRRGENWVVRGGWARIFNSSYSGGGAPVGSGVLASTPFLGLTSVVTTIDGIHPAITPDNWYPNGFNLPLGRNSADLTSGVGYSSTIGPEMDRVPYLDQWNLGFERALRGNALLKVSYVGTLGKRLGSAQSIVGDQLPIAVAHQYGNALFNTVPNPFYGIITGPGSPLGQPTIQQGQLLHAWPQFNDIVPACCLNSTSVWPVFTGQKFPFHSNWQGMLASFEKHFASGSDILVSYTLSKQLTNADQSGWMQPTSVFGPQNMLDATQEYSLSVTDVPQRLVVSHAYYLPLGKGQHFGNNMNRWADAVLGGWRMSGILTLASGFPLPIGNTPDLAGVGGPTSFDRPNLVGKPRVTAGNLGQRLQQWVDPSVFQAPLPFTFGNAPRVLNGVRADPLKNYDFSLAKDFALKEALKLQFRGDAFNLVNHPRFAEPNMLFGSTSFGQITSTAGPPRFIQLSLRLAW